MEILDMPLETMQNIVAQEMIEQRFNRKHIDERIRTVIRESDTTMAQLNAGIEGVRAYMAGTYYESKMKRIAQLKEMDLAELVMDIFTGVAYCLRPQLFTSVSAQMAARLKFDDKRDALTTVAELLAVLCATDAFDINKESRYASLMLQSRIPLGEKLERFIEHSEYLPPMVCTPLPVTHNYSSGYLTHNDSLILGSGNHHDGDLCLDVINIVNGVGLKLDTQFLSTVEEAPTFELESQDQVEHWNQFLRTSYAFYSLMAKQGNRFYLTNKVDKRGRLYASGYHINTQGAPFKKASIEFAREEIVEGVPT